MTDLIEYDPAPAKQIPAFYIFTQAEDGKNRRVGAGFRHGRGNGFNVLIGKSRYVAFPPKAKNAASATGEGEGA